MTRCEHEPQLSHAVVTGALAIMFMLISSAFAWSASPILYVAQAPTPIPDRADDAGEPDCSDVPYRPLSQLTADRDPPEQQADPTSRTAVPAACSIPRNRHERYVNPFTASDDACGWDFLYCDGTRVCHQPLYFEERDLERYGYTGCLPSIRSGARFAANTLLYPLRLHHQPPKSCQCSPCAFR